MHGLRGSPAAEGRGLLRGVLLLDGALPSNGENCEKRDALAGRRAKH
jgi:hypothetical protein